MKSVFKHAAHWFEIPVTDLKRAKKFYETIFEITMPVVDLPSKLKMALFPSDEKRGVGGALCFLPRFYKPSADGTLIYLNADPDMPAVLLRIERNGGKVIVPRTFISHEHGYMAVFMDTEGNRIALHSEE